MKSDWCNPKNSQVQIKLIIQKTFLHLIKIVHFLLLSIISSYSLATPSEGITIIFIMLSNGPNHYKFEFELIGFKVLPSKLHKGYQECT